MLAARLLEVVRSERVQTQGFVDPGVVSLAGTSGNGHVGQGACARRGRAQHGRRSACQPAAVPFYRVSDGVEDGVRTIRVEYRDTGSVYTSYPIRLIGMHAALRRLRRSGFAPDVVHARVFYSGFAALLLLGRGGPR